ncbi:MAG: Trm112 family protein [Arenimonas sp.]|uniref:Trm112 family protein n=1 Tax=Arenimonas sp. TaxID=1872635 RepID=UPI0025C5A6EE|nr:Trm112 family protein [Arenimonas sp.]MBW8367466.1 Trm112 family protein [Arenimonas sp.]
MDRKLLDILCCPTSKQPLALLGGPELAAVNRAIAAGTVVRADGSPQSDALSEALVTQDRRTVYRIEDGIPVLLADEALAVAQVTDFPR